ncbi:MAG: hypothetical protein JNM21_10760 [Taibaiella sp.]|nr:hypothetical protein [Taibaiella sp.]
MLKKVQLSLALTLGFIVLCTSAIILNLHTWNFVAHELGYNTEIYYGGYVAACQRAIPNENQKEFRRIYDLYEIQIKNGTSFPEKQAYDMLDARFKADNVLIDVFSDGIFVLLSTAGLVLLWLNRKSVREERNAAWLRLSSWLFILIALYCHWFIMEFVFKLIEFGMGIPFKFNAWITSLAHYSAISGWVFLSLNALVSLVLLAYIAIRIVPHRQLVPWLFAGLAGGVLSRLVWYSWMGPILMPHP